MKKKDVTIPDKALRKDLIELLEGGQAHITLEEALKDLKLELCKVRPQEGAHSVYEEIEHMRIAQEDILRYILDSTWESPEWPDGYWPSDNDKITQVILKKAVSRFFKDLKELMRLVKNTKFDLTAQIPHGEGHTYLWEVLLVADHNAYHLGKIVQKLKQLGE